ncbi:MAG: RNA 2',3'-cyclic phosphodiesterase [Planctomycetota bacterium]|nr:MAG: RNA 2',3'-cyclic phosphodiesterase [Planctomycetota bacterium]
MSTMRCFIGAPIGPPADRQLARTIERLDRRLTGIRWVDPGRLHLTLKFLGETPTTELAAISDRIAEICQPVPPFDLGIGGLGCFPLRGAPRVVWAGITTGSEVLGRLHEQLDAAMLDFGFSSEARAFSPHVTLGRVGRQNRQHLAEIRPILAAESLETRCVLDRIILYESAPSRGGMEYVPVSTIELNSD